MVGTTGCASCKYFESDDTENMVVKCKYKKEKEMKARVKSLEDILNQEIGNIKQFNVWCNKIEDIELITGEVINTSMPFEQHVHINTADNSFCDNDGDYDYFSGAGCNQWWYRKEWLDIQEDKEEMTIAEIEEKLGHGVKVVKES